MKIAAKASIAALLLASWCNLAGVAFAQDVLFLKDGTRAVVVEKRLVLLGPGTKRTIAPKGKYPTADGKYLIVVTGKSATLVPIASQGAK